MTSLTFNRLQKSDVRTKNKQSNNQTHLYNVHIKGANTIDHLKPFLMANLAAFLHKIKTAHGYINEQKYGQ